MVAIATEHKAGDQFDPSVCYLQRFSRVMTRPAGRVEGVSKSRGSSRVGSKHFETSRVGSGRVKRFQNLAGRVGSGQ